MKIILRTSLILNLVLLVCLVFLLANQHEQGAAPLLGLSKSKPLVRTAATHSGVTAKTKPAPFHWSQLEATKSYRTYIANLRAIGCPEPTIEDIVRGDTDRAFSWERRQLNLDGSGAGPWSQRAEMQLVASLLGQRTLSAGSTAVAQDDTESQEESNPVAKWSGISALSSRAANQAHNTAAGEIARTSEPPESAMTTAPSYPLFLQNVNWSALGFTPSQQAAIAQVRQQFLNEMGGLNQSPNDPASQNSNPANQNPGSSDPLTPWQKVLPSIIPELRASLGHQGWMAYEQAQYYAWYQPQVLAAGSGNLTINPDAFSMQ